VSEVATASFNINGKLHRVNLTKVGKVDKSLISSDTKLMEYKFGSYVGSVFGDLFIFKDESYYTYIDGWIISGSRDAIQKYVDKYQVITLKANVPGNDKNIKEAYVLINYFDKLLHNLGFEKSYFLDGADGPMYIYFTDKNNNVKEKTIKRAVIYYNN
jgi:hypothetical protein